MAGRLAGPHQCGALRPRFLDYMLMKVKPLSANRILANHSQVAPTTTVSCRAVCDF
jgi:hypothetical protein